MKLTLTICLCVMAVVLTGCGGGSTGSSAGSSAGDAEVVDGGTFTMALPSDPGNLDPQMSASSALFTVSQLAYDTLVSVNAETGDIQSGLATKWDSEGTTVSLTLAKGITCADGSEFTAADAAANVAFVADPKNQSPFLGTFIPAGATAKADDAAGTLTITLPAATPFALNGLASLPMVCPDGLDERKSLARATSGTGPYELTEAAPGDHYDYKIRDGYTWGPDGASTEMKGMPDKIVIKINENATTAANLLLAGDLNAAQIVGPDAERLEKAGLFAAETPAIQGEQWYNHAKGRPTSDPKVRMALTQALDLEKIQKVLTSGKGGPATTLAALEPSSCPGDSVSGALPEHDPEAAAALLDEAGWKAGSDGTRSKDGSALDLKLLLPSSTGATGSAAAELVVQDWKAVGVPATAKSLNDGALTESVFGGGDWDVSWVTLNVNSPDQVVPFLSGPVAPEGNNFSGIQDADYDAAVKKASAMPGVAGCETWLEAEAGLIEKAEIVPFANSVVTTFGNKATFETPGQLSPTSIRMTK